MATKLQAKTKARKTIKLLDSFILKQRKELIAEKNRLKYTYGNIQFKDILRESIKKRKILIDNAIKTKSIIYKRFKL